MIEDALKSTRTLHRLIMTVALVTIIFSLSISKPQDKAQQKAIIDGLIETDFAAYEKFVNDAVARESDKLLKPIGANTTQTLEQGNHLIFGLDKLGDHLSKPIHVGKLLTNDLILKDVASTTLAALNALNGLSLNQDVQILIPRTDGLLKEVNEFLKSNPGAGRRIDTVRISMDDFDFNAQSFLPGNEANVGLYFELLDAVRTGGAPTFSANFVADIRSLADTSFLFWLQQQNIDAQLVETKSGQVEFAPSLADAFKGSRNEKLGLLSQRLADTIASSSPTNQSVSILGTNVPGSLVLFASPLILFSLAYYFFNHTNHLSRLHTIDEKSFDHFVWLPLSLRQRFIVELVRDQKFYVYAGVLELLASATLLPLISITLLFVQLQQFGDLSALHKACMALASLGIAVFGSLAAVNINKISEQLSAQRTRPERRRWDIRNRQQQKNR